MAGVYCQWLNTSLAPKQRTVISPGINLFFNVMDASVFWLIGLLHNIKYMFIIYILSTTFNDIWKREGVVYFFFNLVEVKIITTSLMHQVFIIYMRNENSSFLNWFSNQKILFGLILLKNHQQQWNKRN